MSPVNINQPGDALAAETVLLEFRAHRTLRNAFLELALKILKLKVSILETVGESPQVGRQTFGFLEASLKI